MKRVTPPAAPPTVRQITLPVNPELQPYSHHLTGAGPLSQIRNMFQEAFTVILPSIQYSSYASTKQESLSF